MIRRAVVYTPPLLVMAAIWFVSSLNVPPAAIPSFDWDKLNHFAAFLILTFSWTWTLARKGGLRVSQIAAAAAVLSILYGAIDEYHQGFVPGRQKDSADLMADTVGSLVAAILYLLWQQRQKRMESTK